LAIGAFGKQAERFSYQQLLQGRYVVVCAKATRRRARENYRWRDLPPCHILRSRLFVLQAIFVDEALARRKLTRRIALRAPFLSAVRILVTSDMIFIVPRRIAQELVQYRPLVIRPLSLASPSIETAMIWPRRLANQPAHRWLRDIVCLAANGLRSVKRLFARGQYVSSPRRSLGSPRQVDAPSASCRAGQEQYEFTYGLHVATDAIATVSEGHLIGLSTQCSQACISASSPEMRMAGLTPADPHRYCSTVPRPAILGHSYQAGTAARCSACQDCKA
jgi:hypothetical protein